MEIALLTGPVENYLISSPVRLLIQKLYWASDEGFKLRQSDVIVVLSWH